MRKWTGSMLLVAVVVIAATLWAQDRLYYFNGVPYIFPASQGDAGKVLTNDGTGTLSWSSPATPEGLWAGSVVLSNVSCPSGWTRLSAADGRILRAAATGGGTGGSDTHTHSLTGSTASQGVTISGNTQGVGTSVTGSTAATSISHTHSVSSTSAGFPSGGTNALTSATVNAGDASHSHGSGTLSGSSHSHSVGTLAGAAHTHGAGSLTAASVSNVPAYYAVVLCVKD